MHLPGAVASGERERAGRVRGAGGTTTGMGPWMGRSVGQEERHWEERRLGKAGLIIGRGQGILEEGVWEARYLLVVCDELPCGLDTRGEGVVGRLVRIRGIGMGLRLGLGLGL